MNSISIKKISITDLPTDAIVNAANEGFQIGDHVRVRYRGQEGTIVDINGDYYMVSFGNRCDSYKGSQLEKAW